MSNRMRNVWPKQLPELTPEQARISHDFMEHWLGVLSGRLGFVDRFNHSFPLVTARDAFTRTLEIGAGIGEHLAYERLDNQEYHCVELRENVAARLKERFPAVTTVIADCQERMDFPDGYFDRVLAIHVLEHLPNLPGALDEASRILKPGGSLSFVIPCDPGLLYGLGRKMSAERIFRRRYGQSYDWFIQREHINSPREIMGLINSRFEVARRRFFPFGIPVVGANLFLGVVARKRS